LTDLLEKLDAAGLRFSDLLLRGQTFRLRVAGRSMSPALWNGDQITVEPASPASLQEGDVILFHQCGQLICHRVVAIQDSGAGPRLITKGDAETGCREVTQPDQVLGRVVAVTRRWPWAGSLYKRTDGWLAQLRDEVAQGLVYLQGLRSYRRIMRTLLSRCFAYHVGIPEGRRWIGYHRIANYDIAELLKAHQRLSLIANLAGICVGSVRVTASGEGYRIDDLYVRIRYRGLGVASRFISFASTLAAQSEAGWLLAEIEKPNRTAIRLFESAGFRLHPSTQSASRLIFVRDYAPAGQRVVP
jgi:signal peptidase I